MAYDAFISYSHKADTRVASLVQSALHRFAKPFFKLRALRVYRDKTSLSANSALWPAIEKALSESKYFLLLASSLGASSPWVSREVNWWLKNRSTEKMLILLTDGDIRWSDDQNDFDWNSTTALTPILRGEFNH